MLIVAYLMAGLNHFYNPPSYWHIIPDYIPYPHTVNILAGLFEIAFALMFIFNKTRELAAWGVVLLLVAFLPVHIDMVIRAPFLLGSSIWLRHL